MSKSRKSITGNSDELHAVEGLPPLRWQRKGSRSALYADKAALSFFQLKGLLLTNEVRNFLQSLIKLNSLIGLPSESGMSFRTPLDHYPYKVYDVLQSDFFAGATDNKTYFFEFKNFLARDLNTDIIKEYLKRAESIWRDVASTSSEASRSLSELRKRLNQDSLSAIIDASKKLQDEVADFEKTHKVDISILDTITLFVCPGCKALLSWEKFRQIECRHCGKKLAKPSELEQVAVSTLSKSMLEIINNNIWLEEGTGWALRREDLDVFVGYNVIGGSGVWHEIDVIAEKSKAKYRILVECKTRALGIDDVFILAGKMRDIGVSSGVLCSTEAEINPEVARLGRTSGIVLGYDILDKPREFWQSLLEKAI